MNAVHNRLGATSKGLKVLLDYRRDTLRWLYFEALYSSYGCCSIAVEISIDVWFWFKYCSLFSEPVSSVGKKSRAFGEDNKENMSDILHSPSNNGLMYFTRHWDLAISELSGQSESSLSIRTTRRLKGSKLQRLAFAYQIIGPRITSLH